MVTEKELLETIANASKVMINAEGNHQCLEIETIEGLLDVFSLYNENADDYRYIELEIAYDVYLCLRYDGKNDLCFNFYDGTQSQDFFCAPEEVTNDWDGASLIINEFETLLRDWR